MYRSSLSTPLYEDTSVWWLPEGSGVRLSSIKGVKYMVVEYFTLGAFSLKLLG